MIDGLPRGEPRVSKNTTAQWTWTPRIRIEYKMKKGIISNVFTSCAWIFFEHSARDKVKFHAKVSNNQQEQESSEGLRHLLKIFGCNLEPRNEREKIKKNNELDVLLSLAQRVRSD